MSASADPVPVITITESFNIECLLEDEKFAVQGTFLAHLRETPAGTVVRASIDVTAIDEATETVFVGSGTSRGAEADEETNDLIAILRQVNEITEAKEKQRRLISMQMEMEMDIKGQLRPRYDSCSLSVRSFT